MTNSFHKVFLTGGASYTCCHTCVEFVNTGIDLPVFDNFCNSGPLALALVGQITGKKPTLVKGDICESAALMAASRVSGAPSVTHFARLKSLGELLLKPLADYENNVARCLNLI